MLLTALPNPSSQSTPPGKNTGGNTVIFASTSQKYTYPEHDTPYLFVTNYVSQGSYTINKRATVVNDKIFYLLQPGSRLAIHFKTATPLQTLLILFEDRFITAAINQCATPHGQLLDDPWRINHNSRHIPDVPFMVSQKLQATLQRLCTKPFDSQAAMPSLLATVVEEFCMVNTDTLRLMQKLQALKTSTREELCRRLTTAVVFMHDNTCANITLNDIANAACLNSFHFLRMFKQAYGTTPHQYVTQLKLERAATLLKKRGYSVTDVCDQVGFESIGSFSALFKKKFGISPSSLLHK